RAAGRSRSLPQAVPGAASALNPATPGLKQGGQIERHGTGRSLGHDLEQARTQGRPFAVKPAQGGAAFPPTEPLIRLRLADRRFEVVWQQDKTPAKHLGRGLRRVASIQQPAEVEKGVGVFRLAGEMIAKARLRLV